MTPDAGELDAAIDAAAPRPSLSPNDVSVLYPLDQWGTATGYLAPSDMGDRGVLLPSSLTDQLPTFPVTPADAITYARLRVVGVRFDACGGPHGACDAQIRLVMQPINPGATTRDSALHVFYSLTAEEMVDVVRELRRIHTLAAEDDGVLAVNPALAAQGIDGEYGTAMRALVLAHCGEENVARMTFFLRAPPAREVWFFGGFEKNEEGEFVAMNIQGVGAGVQRVIHDPVGTDGHAFDLTPNPTTPENGSLLLTSMGADGAAEDARGEAFASYLRLENPTVYVPDDLSCAGCHVAGYLTGHAERMFGLTRSMFPEDAYSSTRNLEQRTASQSTASSLRAFGYFGREAMIAPRTVNETAHVLDDIETRFPVSTTP